MISLIRLSDRLPVACVSYYAKTADVLFQ